MTLYAFSRENWARSDDEVTGLFGLLEAAIRSETDELRAQGVRVRLLGRLDELPDATRASIEEALDATAGGERLTLNVAFNYSGRTEIVDAVRRLAASGIPADAIDEARSSAALYTAGLPDPDLVIRTGGEQRLSNFLIWQAAYAELYSCDRYGPTSAPTRSMPRCSSTPAVNAASAASGRTRGDASASDQCRGARARPARRPRRSAAPSLAVGRGAHRGARGDRRRSGSWRAGYRAVRGASASRSPLVVVLDAAVPRVLESSGILLVAVGIVLAGDRARSPSPIRATGSWPGSSTVVRGAVRLAARIRHPARDAIAPAMPAGSPLARSAPSAAGSCSWSSPSGPSTPSRISSGRNIGRASSSPTSRRTRRVEGVIGGTGRGDGRRRR